MTRHLRAVLLLLLLVLLLPAAAPLRADALDAPNLRLRATDPDIRALIADGMTRSPAFRALVTRLEQSDVVVYVHGAQLRSRLDGQLTFVSAVAGLRYVVVQVAWDLPPLRKLAALGHELQHAIEIADRPEVVDQASLAHAYGHIGFQRAVGSIVPVFDTDAAMAVGEQIWKEVDAHGSSDD